MIGLNFSELRMFLWGKENRKWISVGPYSVYVRLSIRYINGGVVETFDIANIENKVNPGQGMFRLFMEGVAEYVSLSEVPIKFIYVENVLEDRFCKCLVRLGFTEITGTSPPCLYRSV